MSTETIDVVKEVIIDTETSTETTESTEPVESKTKSAFEALLADAKAGNISAKEIKKDDKKELPAVDSVISESMLNIDNILVNGIKIKDKERLKANLLLHYRLEVLKKFNGRLLGGDGKALKQVISINPFDGVEIGVSIKLPNPQYGETVSSYMTKHKSRAHAEYQKFFHGFAPHIDEWLASE